jgi:hypothetical protein
MHTNDLHRSLPSLFSELTNGAPKGGAFVLNGGDAGLLASLDRLTAGEASRSSHGGATVAAHVAHVSYGLSLMNRWAGGEANPFSDADWSAAWRTDSVTEQGWADLRRDLRDQVERWHVALQSPREISGVELDGVIGSVVHLAYHLGAIRQIVAGGRGPKDSGA